MKTILVKFCVNAGTCATESWTIRSAMLVETEMLYGRFALPVFGLTRRLYTIASPSCFIFPLTAVIRREQ